MADDKENYTIIDGKKVPVYNAKVVETIKNKRTGKVYESKEAFDADVNDPNTDTTSDDFRQDLEITVTRAGVIGAKTKK